ISITKLVILLAVGAASSIQAAVVAQYEFTGGGLTSTDGDGQSTASSISLGAGIPTSGGSITIGNPAGSFRFDKNDIGTAFDATDYIEFTVTAGSGLLLDLSSLTFDSSSQAAGKTGNW